ncbi:GntR family transcriptional regulator [Pendulispora brunnea]|uniref:GntR family transcriptional regulator n=1 Tax=Pendulispora brunnea TaxID=2905690 RepID=A0ABZ2KAG4_9BACT
MSQRAQPAGSVLVPHVIESTPSIVASKLREAIVLGELAPGSQLVEMQLAAQLGVSRGPLREAMQRLVQEGLLRSERNRGLFVVELDDDDVRDLYVVRKAIDQAAASLILSKDVAAAVKRLKPILTEMNDAAKRGDRMALSTADMQFHEAFVEASGSPRLIRMARTFLTETRLCITTLGQTYGSLTRVATEHAAILRALKDGNEAKLMAAIQAHMDDALDRLVGSR